ncbi:protein disulfide-isomerase 5-1-like [Rutidosis leptorrhynchoides]|uniref:protein disulfide-isomerase 5-1-like n=1 Tax=Rutidosis leptorrhynchoides TaxID=125765 RepID=UPI003A9A1E5B
MKGDHHRSLITSVLLISSILLSTLMHDSKAEVITLTETTFTDKVNEKDTAWFIKFCVPWCKHCKNLGSLWEDLGKTMEGEDEIEVGEVDRGTNKPLCSKVKIGSYPTFKVFYNGEEVARYRGTKDVEAMRTFVLEETEKAAAATSAQIEGDKDL